MKREESSDEEDEEESAASSEDDGSGGEESEGEGSDEEESEEESSDEEKEKKVRCRGVSASVVLAAPELSRIANCAAAPHRAFDVQCMQSACKVHSWIGIRQQRHRWQRPVADFMHQLLRS